MKKYLIVLALMPFLLVTNSSQAQHWLHSMDEAKSLAAESDKNILMVFQGSDWCAPCIKMEKSIWSAEAFQTYAEQHLVLLQVDFPRRKKNKLNPEQQAHNNALAEKYNTQGMFPFVVVMDKSGSVLGETGYKNCDAQTYVDHIQQF